MSSRSSLRLRPLVLVALLLVACGSSSIPPPPALDPGLGTAANFVLLANADINNTGPSWITGALGVPHGYAMTGFPPGSSGAQYVGDSRVSLAQQDLITAYANASNQPCPAAGNFTNANLGGKTLAPGVYCQIITRPLAGTLTLRGSGFYVFQINTLVTTSSATVVLKDGAQACQIFWLVAGDATLAPKTTFVGNILAATSISIQTQSTLTGRALTRNGTITLDTARVTQPVGCGSPTPVPVSPPIGS